MNVLPAFIGFFASFLLTTSSAYFMLVSRNRGHMEFARWFKEKVSMGFVLMLLFLLIVMFQILFT